MTQISAAMVKELRDKTGAGMMDCKQALIENNGDMDAAVDWLRKKGLSKAAKKSGRVAAARSTPRRTSLPAMPSSRRWCVRSRSWRSMPLAISTGS